MLQYPDSVDMRYAMASTYEEQGASGAALRELKAILKSRPDDPAALNASAIRSRITTESSGRRAS